MNRSGKLHALLATARVANIPSVVSNVWLGVAVWAILNFTYGYGYIPCISWGIVIRLMLAGIFLYIAGNFLNDWMDQEWDAKYRQERALPRGLFSPESYRNVALVLGAAGMTFAASVTWMAGVMAVAIMVCIVTYTYSHKRSSKAVIPMGLCRGFLPVMGALGMAEMPVDSWNVGFLRLLAIFSAFAGSGLFIYIVGLSLSARRESETAPPKSRKPEMGWILFLIAGLLMITPFLFSGRTIAFATSSPILIVDGIVPFSVWLWLCQTRFRRQIPRYVSALLAGIPLLDWIFLLPCSLLLISKSPNQDVLSLACLAIPPAAFVSALLLQRLAPAT